MLFVHTVRKTCAHIYTRCTGTPPSLLGVTYITCSVIEICVCVSLCVNHLVSFAGNNTAIMLSLTTAGGGLTSLSDVLCVLTAC